jgi:hypothetical protein
MNTPTVTGAYIAATISAAHLLVYLKHRTPFIVIVDYFDESECYQTREQKFASPVMATAYAAHLLDHGHPEVVGAQVAYRFAG